VLAHALDCHGGAMWARGLSRPISGRRLRLVTRRGRELCALLFALAALALAGCGSSAAGSAPDASSKRTDASTRDAAAPDAGASKSADAGTNANGVHACAYVPGESQPVVLGPDVRMTPMTTSLPPLPAPTAVPAETTQRQQGVLAQLSSAVTDNYYDPNLRGVDWQAVTDRYRALVDGGLRDDDFYAVMGRMVAELGDQHSYFESPSAAAADDTANSQGQNFVGIGVLATPIGQDLSQGSVIAVWPNSPAADAGLLLHDLLLEVDGQPYRDPSGTARSLGSAGTSFELTYQRPGQDAKTVRITRQAVQGFIPVDSCIVPGTRIGYILLPTFLDQSIGDQVRAALAAMTADGPLDGLIVDNRVNDGGSQAVTQSTLDLFLDGAQGRFVSRSGETPFELKREDLSGSQSVPLAVLTERNTVSFAEIFSGVLQVAGRAKIVGGTTAGNVENLQRFDFDDGSRAWIATRTFAPVGLAPGYWEGRGVEPDVDVPSRWDLFTEATDPVLARAVELLR